MDAPLSNVHIIDVLAFTQPDSLWSSCILAYVQPLKKDLMLNLDQQTSLVNEGEQRKGARKSISFKLFKSDCCSLFHQREQKKCLQPKKSGRLSIISMGPTKRNPSSCTNSVPTYQSWCHAAQKRQISSQVNWHKYLELPIAVGKKLSGQNSQHLDQLQPTVLDTESPFQTNNTRCQTGWQRSTNNPVF